jgi:hypothetical protein
MAASECNRTDDDRPSCHRPTAAPPHAHRLYTTRLDELSQGSFADPNVTADLVKLDPAFRD